MRLLDDATSYVEIAGTSVTFSAKFLKLLTCIFFRTSVDLCDVSYAMVLIGFVN